jgi:CheY-like chemotaxis protein
VAKSALLVDDNVTARSLLADVVRNAGFVVCGEAGDGVHLITREEEDRLLAEQQESKDEQKGGLEGKSEQ